MSLITPFLVVCSCLLVGVVQAHAQGLGSKTAGTAMGGVLFDPGQLPAFQGRVDVFTLTPRGDIDGFVTTDGTEVKTPPHLTEEMAIAFHQGDAVTVHGLKAASLPLIQAMSVTNDQSGHTVVDVGPEGPGRPAVRTINPADVSGTASAFEGRIRMDLHGPRGDVNGVLLDDGTTVKLPPLEAARLSDLLAPGRRIAAEGVKRVTARGTVVELKAIGPAGGALERTDVGARPSRPDGG